MAAQGQVLSPRGKTFLNQQLALMYGELVKDTNVRANSPAEETEEQAVICTDHIGRHRAEKHSKLAFSVLTPQG